MRPCDICGHSASSTLPFYYELDQTRLEGRKCRKCGLMYIHPQPNEEQILRMYGEEYFDQMENYNREKKEETYMEIARRLDLDNPQPHLIIDYLNQHYPGQKFKFLEIGCGPGYLIKRLQLLGWEVGGMEISEFSASFGREYFKLPIQTGSIEAYTDFQENEWEAIYLGDVLEHLRSPSATIAKLKRMLAPGGLLMFALPATMNLLSIRAGMGVYKLLGKERRMDIPPYHLYEFTPATITKLLNKHQFQVEDLRNTVKKPSQIRLGGNKLEALGKLLGQYPTYYINQLTGRFGDRMLVVARNQK
jgi:2-polyprenyl-3-methyl-5-hydroxy-6-metoxy-1,4-benzoquinol methylase